MTLAMMEPAKSARAIRRKDLSNIIIPILIMRHYKFLMVKRKLKED
jgi:hypothetical protein